MKKAVLVMLIVFGVVSLSILIGSFLANQSEEEQISNQTTNSQSPTATETQTIQNNTSQTTDNGVTFTTAQVAEHATSSDCWIIIDNGVYNVTNYLSQHPGGASRITPFCGKDATQAFQTQGGEGSHSSTAQSLKENYLIGQLAQ